MTHTLQDLVNTLQVLDPELSASQAKRNVKNTLKAITMLTQEPHSKPAIRKFGIFRRVVVPAQKRCNPQNGEQLMSDRYTQLKFKASDSQKDYS